MNEVINKIREELKAKEDEKIRASGEKFFKEEIKAYGLKTVEVTKIAKSYYAKIKDLPKTAIFDLCEELWQSGYMEEAVIACKWSYFVRKDYKSHDFKVFEKWINKYVTNWATCDTLCNHTVGEFLQMYPEYVPELKKWAKSKNRWMRRAAAVSLIIPARKGLFLKAIFEIADILHLDKDDLVQKGYGWMLKVTCKLHEKEVFDYVMKHKTTMPRTALRYAIEKMPKELKLLAMEK